MPKLTYLVPKYIKGIRNPSYPHRFKSILIPLTFRIYGSVESTPNQSTLKTRYNVRVATLKNADYIHRLWKSLTADLDLLHFRMGTISYLKTEGYLG